MFHSATAVVAAAIDPYVTLAQAAPAPPGSKLRGWATVIFGVLAIFMGCKILWNAVKKKDGAKPAEALDMAVVVVIACVVLLIGLNYTTLKGLADIVIDFISNPFA